MKRYKNLSGNSGVAFYEIGDQFVKVKFINSNDTYTCSYSRAGEQHVEVMKTLGENGRGLASYISRNVSKLHDNA